MDVPFLKGTPRAILARAALLVCIIAIIDWRVDLNTSFGFLYLFPMLLLGTVVSRWQVLSAALLCTLLADLFDPFPFTITTSLPGDILVFTSLAGAGLITYEVTRSRQREAAALRRLEAEMGARREAEEQLEFLIDSSPAAILTMTPDGIILLANMAAHRLFGVAPNQLPGRNIRLYVPSLARVPSLEQSTQTFRTEMQCRGEREGGDPFLANVFFSTYRTAMGPRMAALVVDASEELREREESNLEQLLAGSRILVGAVSHEIRNVCSAIAVIYENLVRGGALRGNKDFEALGSLVDTLSQIASLELKQTTSYSQIGSIELSETLDELRIVLEPYCEEADIEVTWDVPREIPPVWCDRQRLLQILLNLTKNSERALEDAAVKRIDIAVSVGARTVSIRVSDTGPGIGACDTLFQPFQKGAESTGLGLYLSRAFARSFRGELRHDPSAPGCSFVIDLAIAGPAETVSHEPHTTVSAR